jgi:hypothetical protein
MADLLLNSKFTMTKQRLRISLPDLAARGRQLEDETIAHVMGGCVGLYGECTGDSTYNNCCKKTMNDTGSGRYKIGCIGFTSGTRRICNWTPA